MLFQLHHVFWGPWKGLIKERRQRGKLQLGDRGGMMKQGKHSLGHLLIEGNTVCSKAMLILLLCHPQVHPLCSNAPLCGVFWCWMVASSDAGPASLRLAVTRTTCSRWHTSHTSRSEAPGGSPRSAKDTCARRRNSHTSCRQYC